MPVDGGDRDQRVGHQAQQELAERICAEPDDMSLLAVSVQYYGQPSIAGKINKVTDDFVVLEVSDSVELKFQKGAIAATLPKGTLKAI